MNDFISVRNMRNFHSADEILNGQKKSYLHIQNALCTIVKLNARIQELRTMTPTAQPMNRNQMKRYVY